MSPPEVLLWSQLRRQQQGFKVLRQHPIGPYAADLYVPAARLVIEVDGTAHDYGGRPKRDLARDRYMEDRGYRVLRISARDIMKNLAGTLSYIVVQVTNPLHHRAAPDGPPPHAREEQ